MEWGVLRYGKVGISGTNYRPEIPVKEIVIEKLAKINLIPDPVERATEYFCWATKAQLYWDENKRTSTLVANAILIQNGAGLFTINEESAQEFNENLLALYNDGNEDLLKNYIQNQINYMSKQFSF